MELERYEEAFEAYRNILAVDSNNSGALLGAADALWQMGKVSEAVGYYRRLRALAQRGVRVPEYVLRRADTTVP